jgi:PAS domain S-box-containing protein
MEVHSRISKQNAVLWRLALNQRQQPLPLLEEFKRIIVAATSMLEVSRGSIWLYRQQENLLECALLFESATGQYSRGDILHKAQYPNYFAACASNKYIDAQDAAQDPRTQELATYLETNHISSMLDAPIFMGSQQKGVLCFEHVGPKRQWQDEDRAFAGSIADLVALALAEEDSAHALSFVESAMETAAEAILVVASTGEIRRHNKVAAELFELKPHHNQAHLINHLLPGLMNGQNGLLDQVFHSTSAQITRKSNEDFLTKNKNGQLIHVSFSISKIKHWRGDHALILLQDNTDKHNKAEQLKNSEAVYRTVVEDQPDLIIRSDSHGIITFANKAAQEYASATLEQLVGTSVMQYTPDSDQHVVRNAITNLTPQEPVVRYTHNVIVKDGSQRIISWVLRSFYDSQQHLCAYQAIGRDITREREAEEKLQISQRLEALAVLAGGMAHDFNNLLTPILSFTDLAKTTLPQGTPQINYLNYVMAAANRAKELTRMVLVFSRRDQRHTAEILAAGPLFREIVDFLKKITDAKVQFLDQIDLDVGHIEATPSDLYQIMSNLCTNAIQSMPAGGVLRISCDNVLWKNKRCVQLEVKDTGCGMNQEMLDHIFEPFFTTKHQGTGLGLSVVKGLVNNLGGEIYCKSELNKGSAFLICFPITSRSPAVATTLETPALLVGREKILVVDDEESVVLSVRDGLQNLGYKVETRTSANAAITEFLQHAQDYNLVVTDCTMPLMNGFELVRQIRTIRADIPVILMSGYGQAIKSGDLEQAKISAFIQKPFIVEELAATVRRALRD